MLSVLTCGCQQDATPDTIRLSGQTMGTSWSVIMLPDAVDAEAFALQELLQKRLNQINSLMSTYDPASELSQFNNQISSDWFTISKDTARVIELSQEISALSEGAFDVSVGPLVELWGFGATERGEMVPSEDQISKNLARVGYKNIHLRREPAAIRKQIAELQIDLSAVAKGYAVDALA